MSKMSEIAPRDRTDDPGPLIESEGEPHPADLLMQLMKSEMGSSARRPIGSSQSTESPAAAAPASRASAPSITASLPPVPVDPLRIDEVPLEARALAASPADSSSAEASALQRAMNGLKSALPLVQRLLPLLDGNILAAVANLLAPHAHPTAPKPPDLTPIQGSLTELKSQQGELRGQVIEQNAALNRIAGQLELIREATDRNTLEQQELVEELKSAGKRMNIVALVAFAMLAVSVALNVFLYFQLQRLLP
jgi:hypothetical protein